MFVRNAPVSFPVPNSIPQGLPESHDAAGVDGTRFIRPWLLEIHRRQILQIGTIQRHIANVNKPAHHVVENFAVVRLY